MFSRLRQHLGGSAPELTAAAIRRLRLLSAGSPRNREETVTDRVGPPGHQPAVDMSMVGATDEASARQLSRHGLTAWLPVLTGGHVVIVMVVVVVAVVAAATLAVRAMPATESDEQPPGTAIVSPAAHPVAAEPATEDPGTSAPEATNVPAEGDRVAGEAEDVAAPTPELVTVHVAGKVKRPGVVELPGGARVVDALEAAGGALPDVTLRSVNLAREVIDGEQVLVGYPPEEGAPPIMVLPSGQPSDPVGEDESAAGEAPVDLNTASAQQLQELPGVGPVLAQRLIDYRTEHGGFTTIDELLDVSGIGERTFADLEERVMVGPFTP